MSILKAQRFLKAVMGGTVIALSVALIFAFSGKVPAQRPIGPGHGNAATQLRGSVANPASDRRFASPQDYAGGANLRSANSPIAPTHFRQETRTAKFPTRDPITGVTTYRDVSYNTSVPVFEQAVSETDEEAMKLSALLRAVESGQVKMSQEEADTKRDELTELVNGQFDKRHEDQLQKVAEIEKKAEDLRATLDKRLAAKDEIVQRRVQHLLGQPDPMAWDNSISTYPGSTVSPNVRMPLEFIDPFSNNSYLTPTAPTADPRFAPNYRYDANANAPPVRQPNPYPSEPTSEPTSDSVDRTSVDRTDDEAPKDQ